MNIIKMAYFSIYGCNTKLWVSGNWIDDERYVIQGDKAIKDGKHIYTIDIESQTILFGKDYKLETPYSFYEKHVRTDECRLV
jgi:hypothetical protein